MPKTKMWQAFYLAIGAGMGAGLLLYAGAFAGVHELVHNPCLGISVSMTAGLIIGFSYYLYFKFVLRSFTWPFLRRAQKLAIRPIEELPPLWESSEIDKLDEILEEALATLERLDLFSSIARDIVATLDPQKTLGRIVGTAAGMLSADSGLIFLLDEESRRYTIRASYLLPIAADQEKEISFAAGEGVPGWVATQGEPAIIADAQNDDRVHPILRRQGVKSLISAPLVISGRTLGVLNLFNHREKNAFDEHDVRLAHIYADLAAVAIRNTQLYQEAEEERYKLSATLNDTSDAVVVLDQAGLILLLNQAAERILGVHAQEVLGRPIVTLGVSDLTHALEEARMANTAIAHEVAIPGERTLYASVSPVHDVGWVMVMQDISHLKRLDKLRTEWVAAVSHDMKNPLAVLRMTMDMMEEVGPLNETQREFVEMTQRGIERLRSLVTDVLDLARLEAGPTLRMEAVDLDQVVIAAMAEVQALADEKSLSMTTDLAADLPAARGDAALLTRALVNLLSNAVKYTPAQGRVTLRVRLHDAELQVAVQDTGPGISPESLPHLFERFYRVPGSDEKAEGSGLGLSIVKSIAEKHGGRVWVESKLGQGSTFAIAVPASASQ